MKFTEFLIAILLKRPALGWMSMELLMNSMISKNKE